MCIKILFFLFIFLILTVPIQSFYLIFSVLQYSIQISRSYQFVVIQGLHLQKDGWWGQHYSIQISRSYQFLVIQGLHLQKAGWWGQQYSIQISRSLGGTSRFLVIQGLPSGGDLIKYNYFNSHIGVILRIDKLP